MADRLRRVALLLLAAALLAACGVPGARRPVIDGDGPARLGSGSEVSTGTPVGPSGITDAEVLVKTYLQAAAGRADDRVKRLQAFFTPEHVQRWSPDGGDVQVVRPQVGPAIPLGAQQGGQLFVVNVVLSTVGTLDEHGTIDPPATASSPHTASFKILKRDDTFRISAGPDGVLLDADALTTYYTPHTLYFWSKNEHVLVPDLRYLPKAVPPEQTIVEYLLAGPSRWLSPLVWEPLPGSDLIGKPALNGGKLVLNFQAKATAQLADLMTQLRWSLRPNYTGPIDLQIVGNSANVDSTSTDYIAANPTTRRQEDPPDRYAVYGGRVVPVQPPGGGPTIPQLPDVLRTKDNQRVVSAAISRDKLDAALVVTAGGRHVLKICRLSKGTVSVTTTVVSGQDVGRPVFVDGPGGLGVFVTVDGVLWFVDVDGGQAGRVGPAGLGRYSAVSVAPDGQRVAMVIGGRAYVALLGAGGGRPQPEHPQLIDAGLTGLVGVAWTRETRLVVATAATVLEEVTVDGALIDTSLPTTQPVSQIVAYADNPFEGDSRGPIMYQQGSVSFAYFSSTVAAVTSTDGHGNLTAPFYLDYS